MERRARVTIPATGQTVDLAGARADLVALVASAGLSDRTAWLLCQLVVHEVDLVAIPYGRLEVELTPTRAALSTRVHFPSRAIGQPTAGDPDAA